MIAVCSFHLIYKAKKHRDAEFIRITMFKCNPLYLKDVPD